MEGENRSRYLIMIMTMVRIPMIMMKMARIPMVMMIVITIRKISRVVKYQIFHTEQILKPSFNPIIENTQFL